MLREKKKLRSKDTSDNNCQRGSRVAHSVSKASAVPGAPAKMLLSIGQGKVKQPTEHPALQQRARPCNHKPWAKSSCSGNPKGGSSHLFQARPGSLFTQHSVHEAHSSSAPLTSLMFTHPIISCELTAQAFSSVLVEINFF